MMETTRSAKAVGERPVFKEQPDKGETYLPEGAFKLSKEIIVTQVVGIVVDIIHAELQPLHRLEIVIDHKPLRKLRIQAVQDHLRAAKLIHKVKKDV